MPTGIYKRTPAIRMALRKARLGKSPWNKGIKVNREQYPLMGHFEKHTEQARIKMVKNHKGRLGIKASEKTKEKMRMSQLGKPRDWEKGDKHWNWKGGKTAINKRIRDSAEWSLWRSKIFKRDNYTCQMPKCGKVGVYFEPHHIISRKDDMSLIFDVNNGITLCKPCHDKTKRHEKEYETLFISIL